MSSIIPFKFHSNQVRVLKDDTGAPMFVARDVAIALGYKDPVNAIKQHCRGVVIYHSIPDSMGRDRETRVIHEPDLYRLIIKSDLPSAVEFEQKVFEEILPAVRKTGEYRAQQPAEQPPAMMVEIQIAEAAARMLRLSDTSKLRMLSAICEDKGVSSRFLPDYSDEGLTKALGDLLKEHGSSLSARAVNPILCAMGLLEELERRGKSAPRKFKSLTAAGLQYGKNETSTQNPNETQPRYYVAKFPQLLALVNEWIEGGAQ